MPDKIIIQNILNAGTQLPTVNYSTPAHSVVNNLNIVNITKPTVQLHPAFRNYFTTQKQEKLPVIKDISHPLYQDRFANKHRWFLPDFRLKTPDEIDRLFEAAVVDTGIKDGEVIDIYSGEITIGYEKFQSEETKKAWESQSNANPSLKLKEIPITLKAFMLFEWKDESNKTITEKVTGVINEQNQTVTITLTNELFKIAYFIIGHNIGKAQLLLEGIFDGWVPTTTEVSNINMIGSQTIQKHKVDIAPINNTPFNQSFSTNLDLAPVNQQRVNKTVIYSKSRFTTANEFTLNFSCQEYGSFYELKSGNTSIPFGCLPPWNKNFELGKRYEQVFPNGISTFPGKVFKSLIQPLTYLIVPDSYVICRDNQSHLPAVSMTSAVNPELPDENIILFNFAVAPLISDYDLIKLKKMLSDKPSGVISFIYPTDLGKKTEFEFSTPIDEVFFQGLALGDNFTFELSSKNITSVRLLIEQLKASTAALSGTIEFEIDDQQFVNAAFRLNLNETVGNVFDLDFSQETKKVKLKNLSESPVDVKGIVTYQSNSFQFVYHKLPEIQSIEPDDIFEHLISIESDDQDKVAVDFIIKENIELGLSDRKISVDLIEQDIGLTSSIDPSAHGVKKLSINVVFPFGNSSASKELIPQNNSFEEVTEHVKFILPLDKYLEAKYRIIEYKITAHYNDENVAPKTSKSKVLNFVKDGANVNVSPALIAELETS